MIIFYIVCRVVVQVNCKKLEKRNIRLNIELYLTGPLLYLIASDMDQI